MMKEYNFSLQDNFDTPLIVQNRGKVKIGEFENIFASKIISVYNNFNLSPNISFLPIKDSSCQLV